MALAGNAMIVEGDLSVKRYFIESLSSIISIAQIRFVHEEHRISIISNAFYRNGAMLEADHSRH